MTGCDRCGDALFSSAPICPGCNDEGIGMFETWWHRLMERWHTRRIDYDDEGAYYWHRGHAMRHREKLR